MGIASIVNPAIAEGIVKELTEEQRKHIQETGETTTIQDQRNEVWTPGVDQWVRVYCHRVD